MGMIKLELSIEETNYVLKVLNNLPTESNVWPLVQKIKEQAIPQTQATEPEQP
jgi:hypothetical protein